VASLGTELPRACLVPDGLGPAIVKADCLRFAVNPQFADAQYVLHALNPPPTRKRTENLVHGVGRPRIGLSLFRSTAIPVPPRSEQVRATALVEQLVSTSSVIQQNTAFNIQRCGRLRQAVLKWAFEGKLVDQDPNDESAGSLLARLRADRVAVSPAKKSRGRTAKGTA
jgi:type I restriction enzyme S subunit